MGWETWNAWLREILSDFVELSWNLVGFLVTQMLMQSNLIYCGMPLVEKSKLFSFANFVKLSSHWKTKRCFWLFTTKSATCEWSVRWRTVCQKQQKFVKVYDFLDVLKVCFKDCFSNIIFKRIVSRSWLKFSKWIAQHIDRNLTVLTEPGWEKFLQEICMKNYCKHYKHENRIKYSGKNSKIYLNWDVARTVSPFPFLSFDWLWKQKEYSL